MLISLTGPAFRNMDIHLGYGQAASAIYNSLKELGLNVEIENPKADIEICFSHPSEYVFLNKHSYKIIYTAWESTDLTPEWKRNMSICDELWATSYWVKNVFENLFPDKRVFVYKHGVNPHWKPKLRKESNKPFTFLHVGEPYSRKDAQMVTESFIELFGNDTNYRLILKASGMNTIKIKHPHYGYLSSPSAIYDNIVSIDRILTEEEMVSLHEESDVFVYPSWGEGWGLQPMQALATGMPVISTDGWADYAKYITWRVDSRWSYSPWQNIHPGLMMQPIKSDLKKQMLNATENYDSVLKETFKNAFEMHEVYDWKEITKPAVVRLEKISKMIQSAKKKKRFKIF
jgi:glycosyltransferase involved in cell wall biosynthesis